MIYWARAGQERVEAAVVALRKARATERCRTSPYGVQPTCTLVTREDFDEIFVAIGSDARDVNHRVQASALLDGFSVDEVTSAEAALA